MARGFENTQTPLAADASAQRADAQALRRRMFEVLPPGRAIDHADLLDQCDEGNQTSRAITLRKRILARTARNPNAAAILAPDELERVLRHLEAVDAPRSSLDTSAPVPLRAPIDEWPRAGE